MEFWQLKANEVEVNVTNFDSLFLYVTSTNLKLQNEII